MTKAGVASLSTGQEKYNVSHTWYLKLGEGDFKKKKKSKVTDQIHFNSTL